jgi:hypothetical protein
MFHVLHIVQFFTISGNLEWMIYRNLDGDQSPEASNNAEDKQ